ncbi:MAG: type I DNA topoisomerase [Bacillota bacterium]|nr:type I DNA topoisomerase [Bacillota bacterium]
MSKNLLIVESPSKARTIKKFLGSNYKVTASVGHLRDLPKSKLGIDIDNDFEPNYITIRGKGKVIKELKKEAKKADKIYLATDPDREGEAISWHIANILKLDENDKIRIEFNEITKDAIKNAVKSPRNIDFDLVNAQQARRLLDRLVGYKISPLLWKKIERGLSAGRVQSVAVKLICDREDEIEAFEPEEYWTLDGIFDKDLKLETKFKGKLEGKKVKKVKIDNKEKANELYEDIKDGKKGKVYKVNKKNRNKRPYPPFITSTLQQDANRKLGFSTKKTMVIAQQLYEGIDLKNDGTVGLITYIRTDSYRVSDEAKSKTSGYIKQTFGEKYLYNKHKFGKNKKGAQDAHECIRPTYIEKTPDEISNSLTSDQLKLYNLIWERFISSMMSSAKYESLSIDINIKDYIFRYNGKRLVFDGFTKVYSTNDNYVKLPDIKEEEILDLIKLIKEQHFTNPPPRFNEASLVKTMEELGIGRPSTYAPTISTILYRNYVQYEENKFMPTELGRLVTKVLVENFKNIINEKFTADFENKLDLVEEGSAEWKEIIREFYDTFSKTLKKAEENIEKIEKVEIETDIKCEKCGANMVVKKGRFGKFLACPNYPECKNTKPYDEENGEEAEEKISDEKCENCGANLVVKKGRYGEFLACPNYPECKFTKQITKSTGIKCPKCDDGEIVQKKSKKGRVFYGCSNYPDCDFVSWNKPIDKKCDECGSIMVQKNLKSGGKVVCSNKDCPKK